MKIRNKISGGLAETDSEQAERLIAGGGWEYAEAPKPAKRAPRKAAAKDNTSKE